MYLSRISLTPQMAHKRIQDDYSVHKMVYDLFSGFDAAGKSRVLYVDKGRLRGIYTILVLSPNLPKEQDEIHVETKPVAESFLSHRQYAFEVVLNPVRRNAKTRKLEPVVELPQLLQWFLEKAKANGFAPDEKRLVARTQSVQTFTAKENTFTQHKVVFSGTLTVTDPALFAAAFANGIGRGKGFGFGLLQLNPIS
ncbi:MAG: type I-E CRISPR-associated protein Cas6/Cse3/CasE [Planctomycetia bacterium]|nr:type I-E CRISPR-associated protein Cas6/Cse3/CasE [Planctomycetia bacterium]